MVTVVSEVNFTHTFTDVIWNSRQRAKHEQIDYDRESYTAYYDS